MRYTYPCLLTPEDEGGFSVSFPDVPAALTCGDNRAEALERAEDALAVALGAYVENREDLPLPGVPRPGQEMVAVPPVVAAKLALYTAMRNQNVTTESLAERLGSSKSAVWKLLDPDHRSPIDAVDAALRAIGRNLVIEDRAA